MSISSRQDGRAGKSSRRGPARVIVAEQGPFSRGLLIPQDLGGRRVVKCTGTRLLHSGKRGRGHPGPAARSICDRPEAPVKQIRPLTRPRTILPFGGVSKGRADGMAPVRAGSSGPLTPSVHWGSLPSHVLRTRVVLSRGGEAAPETSAGGTPTRYRQSVP